MFARRCQFTRPDGRACGATPLREGAYCFWHAPETADEAAEARRLGGLRRRREKAVAGAYALAGLGDVESIRRILEIAVVDALGLDSSIGRVRILVACALAALRLLEAGELEARLAALEAAQGVRPLPIPAGPGLDEAPHFAGALA
jgi:hypothetical protein